MSKSIRKKLAIISTHPIQYNAPLFKLLAERNRIDIRVFYTWSQSEQGEIFDPGFGISKKWDIPLLAGYPYQFSRNIAKEPGSHHFSGIINPDLQNELQDYGPDAIMVYGWSFRSHLSIIRKMHKKYKIYFRGDSTLIDDDRASFMKRIIKKLFLRGVYRKVSKAFYAGQHNRKYFKAHGIKEEQLVFMPHAVDNDRFASASIDDVIKFREGLGIGNDEIIYLFAGKLEEKKAPFLLIDSFAALKKKDLHLLVVGNGILENQLKEKFAHAENIHFLPFQNQAMMPLVYASADVFILPSQGPAETWGLAVNEAMAAGKAIIVSDRCGCSIDLVKDDYNGYIFKATNKQSLINCMEAIYAKGKPGIEKMGKNSSSIIADWNFENCARVIEDTLVNEL